MVYAGHPSRSFVNADREVRTTANVYVAPFLATMGSTYALGKVSQYYATTVVKRKIKMTEAELAKVKTVKTTVELRGEFGK